MLTLRIIVFLFMAAFAASTASAQFIHTAVAAHSVAVKQPDPSSANDSATNGNAVNLGTQPNSPAVPSASSVESQPGGQAGMVITNAWPNPLHTASTLHLEVLTDKQGPVNAGIYALDGTQKATLELGQMNAGSNELQVAAPDLPSGEYIIRLQQGSDKPEIVRINYIK
jgi:hypothetical protein